MPRLVHILTTDQGWGRETREWSHEEGERGAYEAYAMGGCLRLISYGSANGERRTEFLPWAVIKSYTVSRVRSRRK